MGQTSSLVSEDTRPDTLSDRSIAAVADLIKGGRAKRIVVMTGAGISTAAGIPDFRSPRTGLYHNLARLNLPHPEAVFEIDFFRDNPRPFYVLAKELYPGNFHPTISHAFVALLARKKLLRMLFTQNIDCLERTAGVPAELIVEAHGSFATQRCIDCKQPFPDAEMRKCVESASPAVCTNKSCGGLVKPDIVFFGEQLPSTFFDNATVPQEADLVIVVGTSLLVHPFASLPRMAREGVPRLLFNMERVGDFGTRADDVACLGPCDDGIRKLADELGWRDELENMWVDLVGEPEAARQRSKERQEQVDDELDELVQGLQQKLELSEDHDGHESNTIANARLQEKKERETSTTVPDPPPTQSTDGAPVAVEEVLPARQDKGDIEAGEGDESPAHATPDVSKTDSGAKEQISDTANTTTFTPVQNAGGEYRVESDNQAPRSSS
ncbi:DHS-like NAD/FAD-binding domain-containing protein [Xylaria bambusicola]|uniref:DHS-like NAD/FAD-binding domain-containing protein n=1 Tax=Xylaria bambusicola TaxID=326684 RepID=UPI0020073C61|nr:DHS-like NAD/FAD-binding domain-containing protein [Xylaria bambusicola]KAI0522248.1 DHS-like NAD/FAD-binding domain-containing protein [Xylaria bambusicola]